MTNSCQIVPLSEILSQVEKLHRSVFEILNQLEVLFYIFVVPAITTDWQSAEIFDKNIDSFCLQKRTVCIKCGDFVIFTGIHLAVLQSPKLKSLAKKRKNHFIRSQLFLIESAKLLLELQATWYSSQLRRTVSQLVQPSEH